MPYGDIEVVTPESRKRATVNPGDPPLIFRSPAGIKRAGYTFAATIWITVHSVPADAEQSDEAMRALLTVPSFDLLAPHCKEDSNQ